MSKKAFPRWPAALAASLGLHLVVLFYTTSEGPRLARDPMIEVEVLPVHAEIPAPMPLPEPAKPDPTPRGGELVGKRRGPTVPKVMVDRSVRSAAHEISPAETQASEVAPSASAVPEPASAEGVSLAKAVPSAGAAPNPSPVATAPRMGAPKTLAPAVGDGLLAINPNDGDYQPTIPQPLRRPGASFLSRLKFCVASDGSVDKVTVVTSSEPALDQAILEKARRYRFHPYFDQGRAIPFCFYREFRLSIHE